MKFWISSYALKNHKAGVGTYYSTIIRCLQNADIDYEEFTCKFLEKNQFLKFKYLMYFIWLNTYFYIKTYIQKPDIIFFPGQIMPFFKVKNVKYIATIHDLAVFKNFPGFHPIIAFLLKFFTNVVIKRADIIVGVTEFVKADILEKYPCRSEDNVKVVYNSVQKGFDVPSDYVSENIQKYGKYILAVGEIRKNKNITSLIEAYLVIKKKYPHIKLILVGAKYNDNSVFNYEDENIIFTGYVETQELISLYKNAQLFVFPSIYEGFGIPIIEAQNCDCPVLCSDIKVFREVAENSAEFCEPTPEGIAKKIEYLLNNPDRLQELSKLGRDNIKRFTIEQITKQLKNVI